MQGPDSTLLLDKLVAKLDICWQEVILFDELKNTSYSNI